MFLPDTPHVPSFSCDKAGKTLEIVMNIVMGNNKSFGEPIRRICVNESLFFLILTIFFPGMVLSQEKIKMNQKPSGNISLLKAQILSLPGCIVIALIDRDSLSVPLKLFTTFTTVAGGLLLSDRKRAVLISQMKNRDRQIFR